MLEWPKASIPSRFGGRERGGKPPPGTRISGSTPTGWPEAMDLVVDELSALDDSVDWASQAADYRAEVTGAGVAKEEILAVVPAERRKLVTNHDSLGYFADRYGFEVVGTVIPVGGPGPSRAAASSPSSSGHREAGVSAIFAEHINPTGLAETVAAEVGREISVVEIYTDSLGSTGIGRRELSGDDADRRPPGRRGAWGISRWTG